MFGNYRSGLCAFQCTHGAQTRRIHLNRFNRLPILFALQHFRANHCAERPSVRCLERRPWQSRRSSSPTDREIAIRVFRAANELGIKTVAIWAEEDKLALHRFKADESYQVGRGPHLARDMGPIESYLSIEEVHPRRQAVAAPTPSIRATACCRKARNSPTPARRPASSSSARSRETMRQLGNKVAARNLAIAVGVPVVPATDPLPDDMDGGRRRMAAEIGYPVMLKASLGRRRARHARASATEADLAARGHRKASARRRPPSARTRSISKSWSSAPATSRCRCSATRMAIVVHLFERDCSIQRRNQKVVERAPAPYLDEAQREELCGYALKIAQRHQLYRRRHGRVPDGCRHRQILLHRGQSAHPGRAHGDRESSPASTSSRRRSTSSTARPSARRNRACRRRRTSG